MKTQPPVQKPKPASARVAVAVKPASGLNDFLIILGGIAACIAIALFLAPDWSAIPPYIKLAGHAALNSAVAFALYHGVTTNGTRTKGIDGLTVLLAFLTLTFIALVSKTYKLQYPLWQMALFWMALVTPFWLSLSQGRRGASVTWIFSAVATYFFFLFSKHFHFFSDAFTPAHALTLPHALAITLVPFALIGLGESETLRKYSDKAFNQISLAGFLMLLLGASLAQDLWYQNQMHIRLAFGLESAKFNVLAGCTGAAVLLASLAIAWARQFKILIPRHQAADAFLVVSAIMAALPLLVPHARIGLMAVPLSIAYWLFAAWAARKAGYAKAFQSVSFLIALRLFLVYVEICDTFVSSPIGMVASLVVLGLIGAGSYRATVLIGKKL